MNKIGKALEELQKTASRQGLSQRTGDRPNDAHNGGARIEGVHTNDAQAETLAIEPTKSVEIDPQSVAEHGLAPHPADQSLISNQFRRVKRPILQVAFDNQLGVGDNANVIMVASALPGAGKSFCAYNLAQSVALERDVGAVLVDADVLKGGVSRALGLEEHVGLIDYLVDPTLSLSDILLSTNLNDVLVIPAGRRHPEATELLASRRMQELIETLSQRFRSRAVIFDTPPLLITNEARVLGERMGQIVFVVEARVSTQEAALRALSYLDRDKPINAILNKSRSATESGYNSDDYGYYSYPGGSADEANG